MAQTIIKGIEDEYVVDKIYDEGLDYMFTGYMHTSDILDPELRKLAETLASAVEAMENYLEDLEIPEDEDA